MCNTFNGIYKIFDWIYLIYVYKYFSKFITYKRSSTPLDVKRNFRCLWNFRKHLLHITCRFLLLLPKFLNYLITRPVHLQKVYISTINVTLQYLVSPKIVNISKLFIPSGGYNFFFVSSFRSFVAWCMALRIMNYVISFILDNFISKFCFE